MFEFTNRKMTSEEQTDFIRKQFRNRIRQMLLMGITLGLLIGFLCSRFFDRPMPVAAGVIMFVFAVHPLFPFLRKGRYARYLAAHLGTDRHPETMTEAVRVYEDRVELEDAGEVTTVPFYTLSRVINNPSSPCLNLMSHGAMVYMLRRADIPEEGLAFFADLEGRVGRREFPVPADALEQALSNPVYQNALFRVPLREDKRRLSRLARREALRNTGASAIPMILLIVAFAGLLFWQAARNPVVKLHLNPQTLQMETARSVPPWLLYAILGGSALGLAGSYILSVRNLSRNLRGLFLSPNSEGCVVVTPDAVYMVMPAAWRRMNRGHIRAWRSADYVLLASNGFVLPVEAEALTAEQTDLLLSLNRETPEQINQNQGGNGHE